MLAGGPILVKALSEPVSDITAIAVAVSVAVGDYFSSDALTATGASAVNILGNQTYAGINGNSSVTSLSVVGNEHGNGVTVSAIDQANASSTVGSGSFALAWMGHWVFHLQRRITMIPRLRKFNRQL